MLNGDTYHPSWIDPDPKVRNLRLQHTLNSIDVAVKLNVPSVSTEPGGPLRPEDKANRHKLLELFELGITEALKYAEEKKVFLLIETGTGTFN